MRSKMVRDEPAVATNSQPEQEGPPAENLATGTPLRLIVIPFLLVTGLVLLWLQLRWPTHENVDPQTLVERLRQGTGDRWYDAYVLSRLLSGSEDNALRTDESLCRAIGEVLDRHRAAEPSDADAGRLSVFLCRALGEFRLEAALPFLVRAASDPPPARPDVRCAALEGLAVLAGQLGPQAVRSDTEATRVLLAASATRATGSDTDAAVRSAAAFALGVVGGPPALERLAQLCQDSDANTRFNAATGLARWGDARAMPVLVEMLDPDSPSTVRGEQDRLAQARKRSLVLVNAIRAAVRLAEANPRLDRSTLADAMQRLSARTDLAGPIPAQAREALLLLKP